jgi:1-acyl-sn-glycerol-3-phosphate acyltransferase
MLDFIKPAPSPIFILLAKIVCKKYIQMLYGHLDIFVSQRTHQIFDKLTNTGIIICPNHPALPDPEVMFAFSAFIKEHFYFLAARELFGKENSWQSKWFQKLGCYSVERGRLDISAFRATKRLLEQRQKVVIFPEGEISFQNDYLIPIENGPEHIALSILTEM